MICILVQFGKLIASLINSVEANHTVKSSQIETLSGVDSTTLSRNYKAKSVIYMMY